MFLDPDRFRAASALQGHFETLRRELHGLRRDDFQPWPQPRAYTGTWSLFPLWLHEPPADLVVDYEANRRRCPESVRCLGGLDGVRSACFSWLGPGSHIYAHTDAYYPDMIRLHIGLLVPPQSLIRVGEARQELRERQVFMIDGQVQHEVANLSDAPRVTLLVDVVMNDEESRYVLENSPDRRRAMASYSDSEQ